MPPKGMPLKEFLKTITSAPSKLSMTLAMQAASILIPNGINTLEKLHEQSKSKYLGLGLPEETAIELMKLNKKGKAKAAKRKFEDPMILPDTVAGPVIAQDLDFDEILWEPALVKKSVVTNRSPIMTLWAVIVAEKLGFSRQSALSLASVYTELNSTTKGVSLGIMPKSSLQSKLSSNQPYIELMGRSIPVIQSKGAEWRGLSNSAIVPPEKAFKYVTKAFQQQLGAVAGAMRVLANSFSDPEELNRKGYGLYEDFRPENAGWGEKVEVRMSTILLLKKEKVEEEEKPVKEELEDIKVKIESNSELAVKEEEEEVDEKPSIKRVKLEEDDSFAAADDEKDFETALCLL